MSLITVLQDTRNNYRYSGSTAKIRIFANQTFTTSTGSVIHQGGLNSWYKELSCTISGNILTIPQFTIDSTVDSSNANATYTAVLYDASGNRRDAILSNFRVPVSLGETITWAALASYNAAAPPKYIERFLNADQVAILIDTASGLDAVKITGDQTVDGTKTFTDPVIVPHENFGVNYDGEHKAATQAGVYGAYEAALDAIAALDAELTASISAVSGNVTTLDAAVVKKTGDQTIAGVKTFSSSPIVPVPTTEFQAVNKGYVDVNIGSGGSRHLLSDYDDLADAVTEIGSDKAILIIDEASTYSTAITIPTTLLIEHYGFLLTKSGSGTIEFEGVGLVDPESRIALFANAGTSVTWTGSVYPKRLSSALWNDATLDIKLQNAIAAMDGLSTTIVAYPGTLATKTRLTEGLSLHFTEGYYLNTLPKVATVAERALFILESNTRVYGDGRTKTTIQESSNDNIQIFVASGAESNPFEGPNENIEICDLRIDGHPNTSVNSANSSIFLGNIVNGHVRRCHFDDIGGFAVYIGAFPTAGHYADTWSITDCTTRRTKTQVIGCIGARNGVIAHNIITEVQPVIYHVADAATDSSSSTVTSATGGFTIGHVGFPVRLIKPGETTQEAFIDDVIDENTITLMNGSATPINASFTGTAVAVEVRPPSSAVFDLEPNSEHEVLDNIQLIGNIVDGRMAQENWYGVAVQATDAFAGRNIRVSDNIFIGRNTFALSWYSTDVSTGADTITIHDHQLRTGQKFATSFSGSYPGGISQSTTYFIIKVDNDTIKLAHNYPYAMAGIAIDLTTTGSGKVIARPFSHQVTGIQADGCYNGQFTDNLIQGTTSPGMTIGNSSRMTVSNNDIIDAGNSGAKGIGVRATILSKFIGNNVIVPTEVESAATGEIEETEITNFTVNTDGTTVTLTGAGQRFRRWWEGRTVTIDGDDYTVDMVRAVNELILTSSAGTKTGVTLATKNFSSNSYKDNDATVTLAGTSSILSGFNDRKITEVADAAHTATTASGIIVYTSLTAGRTVTLPAVATCKGKEIVIKDGSGDAATHNITIDGADSEEIDGAATYVIDADYGKVTVKSTGTAWITV